MLTSEESPSALLERESKLAYTPVNESEDCYETVVDRIPKDSLAWEIAVKETDRKFPGYLYFIRNTETGYVKIGLGLIMRRRLASIQYPNAALVTLCRAIPVSDCIAADRTARDYFASRCYKGEWFRLTDNDIRDYVPQ